MGKLVVFLLMFSVAFCDDFGKLKTFNNTNIYYTSAITENEVDKLGAFLINIGFAGNEEEIIQLNKTKKTYEFRMVVKKGMEQDQELKANFASLARIFSLDVFDNAPVEVHFCDKSFKTLVIMTMATSFEAKIAELMLAAGIWLERQKAYFEKFGKFGSNEQIDYISSGEHFFYETHINDSNTASWKAIAKKATGDCKDGIWTVIFKVSDAGGSLETDITGDNCEKLTPDFKAPKLFKALK